MFQVLIAVLVKFQDFCGLT